MDARFYNPITFAAFLLGFQPDPVQTLILLSTALRGVLNCTRQWGKSSIMAVRALWEAMTVHGTTVLVLCPTFRQAGEFFQKIRNYCCKLGIDPAGDGHIRFSSNHRTGPASSAYPASATCAATAESPSSSSI